jgi:hypothetical protein
MLPRVRWKQRSTCLPWLAAPCSDVPVHVQQRQRMSRRAHLTMPDMYFFAAGYHHHKRQCEVATQSAGMHARNAKAYVYKLYRGRWANDDEQHVERRSMKLCSVDYCCDVQDLCKAAHARPTCWSNVANVTHTHSELASRSAADVKMLSLPTRHAHHQFARSRVVFAELMVYPPRSG